jgi:hypothetical protein
LKDGDLLLKGAASEEWNDYVRVLLVGDICLSDQEDIIVWSWNVNDGQVIVGSYEAMMIQSNQGDFEWWTSLIWKWELPLKIKLFIWLLLKKSILTWDNLC